MNKNKLDIAQDFIHFVKKHDITADGPITSSSIEKAFNYCKRQFDRIFKEYSKYTPIEIAERYRLLCCVEHISNGNTLTETAFQFDYTPEGLSNAIRTKFNLNVKKIKKENFEIEKHIKISNSMVQLDQYKYQIDKKLFMNYIESLNEEKILKQITSFTPEPILDMGFELHFDFNKITNILSFLDGFKIDKQDYENLDLQESVILYAICKKNYDSGNSKFEMPESELASYVFIIGFFFNVESLSLNKGYYKFKIKEELRLILDGLKEIEKATNKQFDIILHSVVKGNNIITQFNPMFKEMIIMFKNPSSE